MPHKSLSPRLLILGSMDEFCTLAKRARERGCWVVVADGYPDGPARAFADEEYSVDIRNYDAVASLCRNQQIDALVTSFSDILFESGCRSAHTAGLPSTCSLASLDYLRNKDLMKRMFCELGIPHPESKTLDANYAEGALEDLRFPCVVKPVDGYGSYDVHVAPSPTDAKNYLQHMFSEGASRVLVEEYDTGHEFNMMCWVHEGVVQVLSIADREKTWRGACEVPHVSRIVYPSRFCTEVIEEASRYAQNIADYLALRNSPLCVQFFWSPDKGVRLCEAAGRIFGYEHELLEHASGLAVEDLLLDLALGQDCGARLARHNPLGFARNCCGVYFHTHGGTVGSLETARRAIEVAGATEWIIYYDEGDLMTEGRGSKPYVARAFLEAPTREALDATTQEIFDSFSVKSPEGVELVLPNELPTQ